MKIKVKNNNVKAFSELEPGVVFVHGETPYLKLKGKRSPSSGNCVDLSLGMLSGMPPSQMVTEKPMAVLELN